MKQTYQADGHITLENMSVATWYNWWTTQKFEKYLKGTILDAGCGHGSFTKSLTDYGVVTAIDTDSHCIKKTKKLVGLQAKVGYGNIEENSYFFGKAKRFDSIVCINVIEHIQNDTKTVKNLISLLKPKGHLIILAPSHPFLHGSIDTAIGHYRRYTKSSISSLFSNHMSIRFMRRINFFGAIGWFVSGKLLHTQHVSSRSLKIFNTLAPVILRAEDIIEPPIGTSILVIAQKK